MENGGYKAYSLHSFINIRVQDGLHNKALFSCKPFLGGAKLLQGERCAK